MYYFKFSYLLLIGESLMMDKRRSVTLYRVQAYRAMADKVRGSHTMNTRNTMLVTKSPTAGLPSQYRVSLLKSYLGLAGMLSGYAKHVYVSCKMVVFVQKTISYELQSQLKLLIPLNFANTWQVFYIN